MELKGYQQEVINDLDKFIEHLDRHNRLDIAYREFWSEKGISLSSFDNDYLRLYDNSIKGVPRVTVKVPTAGGKTFIACNALRTIFDSLPAEKPKVVAWFVPSDTILKQTYKNLNDPNHPYRQKIDSHFGNMTRVIDKEAALFGQGINPTEIKEQLTIFVLSIQSFATNSKDGKRVFRENENLAEHTSTYQYKEKLIEKADETALIQVIAQLNPVIIIDESHNFEADLRVDLLNIINPCFILDLTATPRNKSNIISFVDAIKLKQANMVKLPVIVYNHKSTNDVIVSAIQLQRRLEQKANKQEVEGGRHIRPIVLFQAQPKTDNDNVTFDKIKRELIEIGIPEKQIKIKTATKDEIKNINLMNRDCEVRFIITVNALKEGWDCPFAYILASLANKTSRVDVEQILGRILRLPYTTQHKEELLNLSYVFTCSSNFRNTLENIIASLNRAGFSKKDYRLADKSHEEDQKPQLPATENIGGLFRNNDLDQSASTININDENSVGITEIDVDEAREMINNPTVIESVKTLEGVAISESNNYKTQMIEAEQDNDEIPNDIKDMTKSYPIKDVFKESANLISLPTFTKRVNIASIFETEGSYVSLTKSMLAEGFDLTKEDHKIDFTRTDIEAVRVDLEERGKDEYVPTHKNLKPQQLAVLREYISSLPPESQKKQLAATIAKNVKFDEIAEPQIAKYIQMAIDGFNNEKISDLITYEHQTAKIVKHKITSLLSNYQEKKFKEWLDTGQVKCDASYILPKRITLKTVSNGLSKGLYTEEGDMNDFEYRVINAVANLDNVLFWHRNPERGKGFCINGFINHYPDFIVKLKSHYTIIIETKGDDRDNTDSRRKVDLGRTWANKGGDNFRYFMVFDKMQMEGAVNVTELINRLKEM